MKFPCFPKSKKLRELSNIIYIIFTEFIRKIFSASIFLKRRNIYLAIGLILSGYIAYIAYNILEIFTLDISKNLTDELLLILAISTLNTMITISILCFLLVELTFKFSNSVIFILKTYPFSNNNINLVKYLCKIFVAFLLYMSVHSIFILLIKEMFISKPYLFIFMLSVSLLLFFFIYNLCFIVNNVVWHCLRKAPRLLKKSGMFVITVIGVLHFFYFRFIIDGYVAASTFFKEVIIFEQHILKILFYTVACLVLSFYLTVFLSKRIRIEENDMPFIPLYKKSEVSLFMVAPFKTLRVLLRERTIISSFAIFLAIILTTLIASMNVKQTVEMIFYALIIFVTVSLHYYGNTENERKLYNLYRFNAGKEFVLLVSGFIIIFFPYILTLIFNIFQYIELVLLTFLVFLVFLMFGILFPKKRSSLNELVAILLSALVITLVFFLRSYYSLGSLVSIIFILCTCIVIILNKDRARKV